MTEGDSLIAAIALLSKLNLLKLNLLKGGPHQPMRVSSGMRSCYARLLDGMTLQSWATRGKAVALVPASRLSDRAQPTSSWLTN